MAEGVVTIVAVRVVDVALVDVVAFRGRTKGQRPIHTYPWENLLVDSLVVVLVAERVKQWSMTFLVREPYWSTSLSCLWLLWNSKQNISMRILKIALVTEVVLVLDVVDVVVLFSRRAMNRAAMPIRSSRAPRINPTQQHVEQPRHPLRRRRRSIFRFSFPSWSGRSVVLALLADGSW